MGDFCVGVLGLLFLGVGGSNLDLVGVWSLVLVWCFFLFGVFLSWLLIFFGYGVVEGSFWVFGVFSFVEGVRFEI